MSAAKHTPGPWVAVPLSTGRTLIESHDAQQVCLASELNREDARLIAAAPELLKALEAALAALECDVSNAPMGEKSARMARSWFSAKFGEAARAAVAKAGGAA